ncbi:chitinase-like protein PB1E7.04c [Aplysia californica]|uniref:Chitinase-like protein PB1E7.04c n=1 Tax=Aplysia californica TaxID=6500 RepID=A0ABM0JMM9_APLCA|nr:chitinase-like protein PB1E7.04c [Aplysia californica]XP_005097260.1 chitinase-like protein PB1E7.04c [Aplysia californica]XP_005097261.1 chitinase-like protein PB1E7.04c [Aplysia californica]XP_012937315.1 chitinase-like protein PB1E7.04c [Aplysia californica]XP_035825368.1 chitinase-like protein PB1E7.04c [Aplysia californica]XP_035825369.1 chitinase-like protein PB1E7.04c [Aplysia californica]
MRVSPRDSSPKPYPSSPYLIGCWSIMVACVLGTAAAHSTPDTCGDYFFLPVLPNCDLYLEAVPCFNNTHTIVVTMATTAGEVVHSFSVTFGSMKELSLLAVNKKKSEGLVLRSTDDISVYVHKTAGDSMVVFPIDSFEREYQVLSVPAYSRPGTDASRTTSSSSSSSSSSSKSEGGLHNGGRHHIAIQSSLLYIFSPFNNTRITLTPLDEVFGTSSSPSSILQSSFSQTATNSSSSSLSPSLPSWQGASSSSSSSPSSTSSASSSSSVLSSTLLSSSSSSSSPSSPSSSSTVLLDAFEIHVHRIDPTRGYLLHSTDVFAVLQVQTSTKMTKRASLCVDSSLQLLDFVQPIAVRGRHFYLAFPNLTDFSIYISGKENTSVDVTTDTSSLEIKVGSQGHKATDVTRTSSAWLSSTQSVIVYVTVAICSNGSLTASDSGSGSATSQQTCAYNGFYLPSVEHYFTCHGNKTRDGCSCACPSVFQRDVSPDSFGSLRNSTISNSPPSLYPLLVGELFDVSTSISRAPGFKYADDVIVTTNNSFMVFRHDVENLNYLPAGTRLVDIYQYCEPDSYTSLFRDCHAYFNSKGSSSEPGFKDADAFQPDSLQPFQSGPGTVDACSCEFVVDATSSISQSNGASENTDLSVAGEAVANVRMNSGGGGGDIMWEEDDEDTTRPMIAVVVSLSVAIFAVIALISVYMLMEMASRRKHVRNTKIRPFVS